MAKKLGSTKSTDSVLVTSANLASEVTGVLPVVNGGTGNSVYTNGQLLIGNTTGNTLTKATLTPGTGISVTNGAGAITVATTAAQTHVTSVGTLSSLTVSGDLTVDTNTFKVDSTNNRVGVGTASPAYTLDSAGYINGTYLLRATRDANQRIDIDCGGPSYPTASGIVSFSHPTNGKTLVIRATTDTANTTRTGGSLGIDFQTYASSRLYISEFGNVGVATTSPQGQVDIPWSGTAGKPTILLGATDGGATRTNATQKNFRIGAYHYTNAASPYAVLMGNSDASNNEVRIGGGTGLLNAATAIVMYTGATTTTPTGTARMTINSSGNVGIGTASPSELLHVSGNILATQNVTAYSDARVKANIEVIGNALAKVRAIRGVTFTRTDTHDATQRYAGVIAQEIEAVLPEVVGENGAGMKHVAYGNIVSLLIEAVKELADIVESRQ